MSHPIISDWPYPFWIAHRGAGHLAPENTLAAFRLGARYGYRMFECDAKLSADGVVFLMHDTELDRTTNGHGVGGEHPWSELARLDAGTWHSRSYAGETIPTLENVARYCRANDWFIDIEIKPTPGAEEKTGHAVAELVQRAWQGAPHPPLLTSFRPESLVGAKKAVPELPRGLLLDTLWDGWFDIARQLECVAIVCNHTLWNARTVAQTKAAGWRALSYTVDDEPEAGRLIDLGTDGIVTNRVDLFSPAAR
jgi:glycerophosphoryl diester phosphodiesterase